MCFPCSGHAVPIRYYPRPEFLLLPIPPQAGEGTLGRRTPLQQEDGGLVLSTRGAVGHGVTVCAIVVVFVWYSVEMTSNVG